VLRSFHFAIDVGRKMHEPALCPPWVVMQHPAHNHLPTTGLRERAIAKKVVISMARARHSSYNLKIDMVGMKDFLAVKGLVARTRDC
jgi:hypothetical protein